MGLGWRTPAGWSVLVEPVSFESLLGFKLFVLWAQVKTCGGEM
jgi:hypothetical protein